MSNKAVIALNEDLCGSCGLPIAEAWRAARARPQAGFKLSATQTAAVYPVTEWRLPASIPKHRVILLYARPIGKMDGGFMVPGACVGHTLPDGDFLPNSKDAPVKSIPKAWFRAWADVPGILS